MLTRLATPKNFSVLRILFLAGENFRLLDRVLNDRSRYVKTPAGGLRESSQLTP